MLYILNICNFVLKMKRFNLKYQLSKKKKKCFGALESCTVYHFFPSLFSDLMGWNFWEAHFHKLLVWRATCDSHAILVFCFSLQGGSVLAALELNKLVGLPGNLSFYYNNDDNVV